MMHESSMNLIPQSAEDIELEASEHASDAFLRRRCAEVESERLLAIAQLRNPMLIGAETPQQPRRAKSGR